MYRVPGGSPDGHGAGAVLRRPRSLRAAPSLGAPHTCGSLFAPERELPQGGAQSCRVHRAPQRGACARLTCRCSPAHVTSSRAWQRQCQGAGVGSGGGSDGSCPTQPRCSWSLPLACWNRAASAAVLADETEGWGRNRRCPQPGRRHGLRPRPADGRRRRGQVHPEGRNGGVLRRSGCCPALVLCGRAAAGPCLRHKKPLQWCHYSGQTAKQI